MQYALLASLMATPLAALAVAGRAAWPVAAIWGAVLVIGAPIGVWHKRSQARTARQAALDGQWSWALPGVMVSMPEAQQLGLLPADLKLRGNRPTLMSGALGGNDRFVGWVPGPGLGFNPTAWQVPLRQVTSVQWLRQAGPGLGGSIALAVTWKPGKTDLRSLLLLVPRPAGAWPVLQGSPLHPLLGPMGGTSPDQPRRVAAP